MTGVDALIEVVGVVALAAVVVLGHLPALAAATAKATSRTTAAGGRIPGVRSGR